MVPLLVIVVLAMLIGTGGQFLLSGRGKQRPEPGAPRTLWRRGRRDLSQMRPTFRPAFLQPQLAGGQARTLSVLRQVEHCGGRLARGAGRGRSRRGRGIQARRARAQPGRRTAPANRRVAVSIANLHLYGDGAKIIAHTSPKGGPKWRESNDSGAPSKTLRSCSRSWSMLILVLVVLVLADAVS